MRFSLTTLLWPASLLLAAFPALAGEPLLVVVEATSGAAVSADEIRGDVAGELGGPVVGVAALEAGSNLDVLIVEVDARTAVLAFQPLDGAIRRRKIDLPGDAPGRRKTIAWLARNLVEDQVGGLPAATAGQSPPSAPVNAPAAQPPPSASASAAPSPLEPPPPSYPASAAPDTERPVVAAKTEPAARSPWSLAIAGGPSMNVMGYGHDWWAPSRGGDEWQVEVQRSMGTWIAGLALDMSEYDTPLAGLAGFVGDGWQRGAWRVEGTAGVGIELTRRMVASGTYGTQSGTGTGGTFYVNEVSPEFRGRLYGRGNVTLAWAAFRRVDLMLRLAVHVETDDQMYSYGSALLGLRMHAP